MGGPGGSVLLLLLVLDLAPHSGVSQSAHHLKYCPECKKLTKEVEQNFYHILIRKANYTICPDNIVRFNVPRGIWCGNRMESWVDNVTNCIDQGRNPCLPPTENQQDVSKGSKNKPPTTTQESTTSTVKTAPSLRLSTQTWKGGTSKPSETTTEELGTTQKILETTIRLTTTAPDSNQNNDLLHGNEPPTEKGDQKSKMKQMTIAIISLLLIILVMTAVGVYVWCRRGKFTACKRQCTEGTVKYQPTLTEQP